PLLLEAGDGALLGAVPLYLKSHSAGEYVFDHGWAEAYEQAGGTYYPKLLAAVPFTPVPGPRLLVRPGPEAETHRRQLAEGLLAVARQLGVSSLHVNFAEPTDSAALAAAGMMQRVSTQYHWENRGYDSFEAFLAELSSRKRKMIRKEREAARREGLQLRRLVGADIKPRHWQQFYRFYIDTSERKWGRPYLTRAFFEAIGERMADRILLVMAEDDGTPVAGALNLFGSEALYGRNWGSDGAFKFLHFEACYYQAIDFAIENRLARVEAGAQGEHKIARGYLPVETRSFHFIADPRFAAAVADFLARETRAVEQERDALAEYSPFRCEGPEPAEARTKGTAKAARSHGEE
ncbi:MAG TPA: GNAT family N-acetyltransferase, partial [Dongiaceae bacterium]